MEMKGIAHVAYKVSDMERALDFYCGALGFRKKFEINDENGRPWIVYVEVVEKQYLELFYGDKNMKSENSFSRMGDRIGYMHYAIEVSGINDLYEKLSKKGVKIITPVSLEADHTWQFWIEDPDGNPIEFHEYTEKSLQLG